MASGRDHYRDRLEETLKELCVADLVDNYCASCASGKGCCAQCSDDSSSEEFLLTSKTVHTSSSTDRASYCSVNRIKNMQNECLDSENGEILYNQKEIDDEFVDVELRSTLDQTTFDNRSTFNYSDLINNSTVYDDNDDNIDYQSTLDYSTLDSKPRKPRHLRIDLSNEDELTDGEILKRLLSPTENFYGDQPLEVILEIVGEEDEVDNLCTVPAVQTLRDTLNDSSSFSVARGKLIGTELKERKRLKNECKEENCNYVTPSYKKANALMAEIENCFRETAQIVERTLGGSSSKSKSKNRDNNRNLCETQPNTSEVGKNCRNISQTVQEALQVFDSIIGDHQDKFKCEKQIQKRPDYVANSHNIDDDICSSPSSFNGTYSSSFVNDHDTLGNHFQRCYRYSFDKDIDELFRQCYELSAVEPSDSIISCLKNLENLCLQLRKAKEHILQEIAEYTDEPSAIMNEDKLSIINELLERKLKSKMKIERFTVVPPTMGLEGRTHKIIAEVFHENTSLENSYQSSEENVNQLDNTPIFVEEPDYVNIPSFHSYSTNLTDYQDSAFNSSSDISLATTNYDSNSSASMSKNLMQTTSDENSYQQSNPGSLEDDRNAILSYEDSMALYEDNKELQQSLLSILHSLNDIHDNFLKRRKFETSLVQKSSTILQNDIRNGLYDEDIEFNFDYHIPSKIIATEELENRFYSENKHSLADEMSEDFKSIENIAQVSNELKNLWLYHSEDLISQNKFREKPLRSVSLSRNYRSRRYTSNRHPFYSSEKETSTLGFEDDFKESMESVSNLKTDLSCSMPNLNVEPCLLPFDKNSSPTSASENETDLVDNFNLQMKRENEKCYEITMNFLERIIDACKILDEDPGKSSQHHLLDPPCGTTGKLSQHHLLDSSLLEQITKQKNEEVDIRPRQSRKSLYDHNAYMRTC